MMLANVSKPLKLQRQQLVDTFNHWKGDYEQIDDVLVIGLRL